jgi:hypothetical protein
VTLEVAMVLPDGSRGNVVELRVHGVSGTPPEELLDRQLVRQVAGDATAGFYRPRLREEWRDRPSNDPGTDTDPYATAGEAFPPPLLEGYSWGGLTSGSPSRALWLVLLPFTLINVAPRMRPVPGATPDDSRRSGWWVWFLARVMAVSLTVTITLGACGVGLAILAWQCADRCENLPWPLSTMFVDASAGWRVLWGAAIPLTLLAVLALLSWRKSVQYDLIRPIGMAEPPLDPAEVGSTAEPRLAHPSFWYGRYPVSRLRHLHLQAGVAMVGFTLVIAAQPALMRTVGMILAALVAALVLAGLSSEGLLRRDDIPAVAPEVDGRATDPAEPSLMARAANIGWILPIWAPVIALLLVGFLLPHAADGQMGGYNSLVTAWFAGQSVLTMAMFVLIVAMAARERPRVPRRSMAGLGTVTLTILALYLGAALTSGVVILAAAWITSSTPWISLDDVTTLLQPAESQILVPGSLQYAGLGTVAIAAVVLIVLVLTALHAAAMWAAGGSAADRRHASSAARAAGNAHPERFRRLRVGTVNRRRKAISRSIWAARRVDILPGFLSVLVISIGVVGAAVTMVVGYLVIVGGGEIGDFAVIVLPEVLGGGTVDPVAVGVWLIVGLLIALVVLGALAFRVPKTRKSVGIIWDIGSFWPRDVHPLAPPCYAERTVPEIAMRLEAHVQMVAGSAEPAAADRAAAEPAAAEPAAAPGLVVLAAHSQGTVISMATLLGPARGAANRTALLTFGTVLRRLYARAFPLYFSSAAFAVLARRLGDPGLGDDPWGPDAPGLVSPALRWRNLWRRTDYLGGKVGDPLADSAPASTDPAGRVQIDVELIDPLFLPVRGDTAMPAAGRHSNFPRDPEFQAQLMDLVRSSFAALNPATAPAPPAPLPWDKADELMNPRESMG